MAYDIESRLHRVFLRKIRDRRLELGLTQSDVASRMGITFASYAQIEHGRRTPTLEMVERVAKALRAKPLELLSEKELAAA